MNCSTLVFIGNGFDIAAGFKTSFGDFYQSNYFQKLISTNPVAKQINDVNQKSNINKWADLEYELYQYAKWLEEEDEPDKQFEGQYNELKRALYQFIHSAVRNAPHTNQHLLHLLQKWVEEDANIQFITFNYTQILPIYCQQAHISESNIRQAHGDMYGGTSSAPEIVMGIDESMQVLPEYEFLNKSFDTSYNNYQISQMISAAKRIIVFGCAMGESDKWYFEQIFKNSIGKTIELYAYQKSSFKNFQQRITELSNKKLADFQNDNHLILLDSEHISTIDSVREHYYMEHPEIREADENLTASDI